MPSAKLRSGLIPRTFPLLFHESPASRTSVFAILNIVFLPSTAFVSKFWRIPLRRSSQIPHPVKISQIPHYTNPASQNHPSRSCKTFSATADLHHVVWLNSLCVYILCFWTDLICNNVVTSSSFFQRVMIVKRYPADYFSQFSIISTLYVWGFTGKKENNKNDLSVNVLKYERSYYEYLL